MRKGWDHNWFLGILMALALPLYVAAYAVLIAPTPRFERMPLSVIDEWRGERISSSFKGTVVAQYRLPGSKDAMTGTLHDWISEFFWPIHSIDRQIRHSVWDKPIPTVRKRRPPPF